MHSNALLNKYNDDADGWLKMHKFDQNRCVFVSPDRSFNLCDMEEIAALNPDETSWFSMVFSASFCVQCILDCRPLEKKDKSSFIH